MTIAQTGMFIYVLLVERFNYQEGRVGIQWTD